MISHNQIIKLFEDIATNHYQINGFGWGDPWEYLASSTPKTPTLWGIGRNTQRNGLEITYNYKILVFDLVKRDDSNQEEVFSDCQRIMLDIISILNSPTYSDSFVFKASNNIEPFNEKFDNAVTGWSLDVSFRVPFDNDPCEVPSSGLPTLIGEYVTVLDQNNNIVTLIPCGNYYSVIVASGVDEGSSTQTYTNTVIDI